MSVFRETREALAIRWLWRRGNKTNPTAYLAEPFSPSLALGQQIVELLITARDRSGVRLELCRGPLKGLQHLLFSL